MQTHASGSSCGGPMAQQYQELGLRIVMGKLAGSQVMPAMHVMMQVAHTLWQMQQACSRSVHTSSSWGNQSTYRTNIYQVSQDDEDLAMAFQASVEHKLQGSMHTHKHLTRLAVQTTRYEPA